MGLLANNLLEIQNLYLQFLGANKKGVIWISALIRKLWDINWYFWNFQNHMLYATYGTSKLGIIELVNKRVTHHLEIGATVLPTRCHFLFHTSLYTLLSHPIRQQLSWLAATYSAKRCLRRRNPRIRLPDPDELLPGKIIMGILIPSLSKIE